MWALDKSSLGQVYSTYDNDWRETEWFVFDAVLSWYRFGSWWSSFRIRSLPPQKNGAITLYVTVSFLLIFVSCVYATKCVLCPSKCTKTHIWLSKIQNFSRGACPRTPLGGNKGHSHDPPLLTSLDPPLKPYQPFKARGKTDCRRGERRKGKNSKTK